MTKVEKYGPCGCGSCEDAIKAALRYRNTLANGDDCTIYSLRVAAAMIAMAMVEYKNDAVKAACGFDSLVYDPMKKISLIDVVTATAISVKAENQAVDEIAHIQGMFNNHIESLVDAVRGKYTADETTKTH